MRKPRSGIPGVGIAAAALDAALYLAEGNYKQAAIAGVGVLVGAAVPFAVFAAVAKVAKARGIAAEASALLENGARIFKAGPLSHAGRAVTKHPEVVGLTKDTVRIAHNTSEALNSAGQDALRNILSNGVRTVETLPRYGQVLQYRIPGGFGARFYAEGERIGQFIGFINP